MVGARLSINSMQINKDKRMCGDLLVRVEMFFNVLKNECEVCSVTFKRHSLLADTNGTQKKSHSEKKGISKGEHREEYNVSCTSFQRNLRIVLKNLHYIHMRQEYIISL